MSSNAGNGAAGAAAGRAPRRTALVVVSEPQVRELLAVNLRAAGFFPLCVASPAEARRLAAQVVPDVLLVDLDDLRDHGDEPVPTPADWAAAASGPVPVLVVLSTAAAQDGAAGALRADLCVAKPFEPRQLMGNLLRLLRPVPARPAARPRGRGHLRHGAIELDLAQPLVRVRQADGWRVVDLPAREHRLLQVLMSEPERVRTRDDILGAVWGTEPIDPRTVDQYVRRLRRSLQAVGAGDLVRTVKGFGYRLA